ncbi:MULTISPECIES: isochorismatase family protein [unclassified Rhizobium]|uniref:isochorismatase family protein n=1 Tax=unclassified Rhizobium TaxID=2613769 RepID=UPI000CDF4656|nr:MULTISPECIES: isochorismatase family protein [Rhizobium]AVA20000.1 isochorismatase-like protein [Rhizobium sp. NXC24]UWU21310.1 isochorismatase family protein [Rhizobium tropici]
MSHADTALLVIDVQESFRQRPYWQTDDLPDFVDRLQALIDGAKARGIPVVQIFHVDGDEHFSLASGYVRKLEEIALEADAVFHKTRHSALVGSSLDVWLVENGIRKLIVSGIRTEQCCETTTRHASDLGYDVDYVTEATLTFPMTHASGTVFSADDIKKRTELVLSGRFARIATVDDALAAATTRSAA